MNTIEEGQRFFDSLDEYNLARIKIDIFLLLDYPSLHTARRVSKGWRDFIDQEIWFVRKKHAMRLIAKEWRENVPTRRFLYCDRNVRDITVDNRILLAKTTKKTLIVDIASGKSVGIRDGISVLDDSIIHASKDISSKFMAIGMGECPWFLHLLFSAQSNFLDMRKLRIKEILRAKEETTLIMYVVSKSSGISSLLVDMMELWPPSQLENLYKN